MITNSCSGMADSTQETKQLNEVEKQKLEKQNCRLISEFNANKLELEAKKHWDLFYKRNENRFFKDRHWTTREFEELLNEHALSNRRKTLLEVGCGVGNLIFPLLEDNFNMFVYACDLSPRAVDLVKFHPKYSESVMKAFQTDITTKDIFNEISANSVDIVTLIFVLSAIHPDKFLQVLEHVFILLRPGGIVLFRDYGLYDMAQLRFKPGHKISENLYMRQDGTRSYFFSVEFLNSVFTKSGFSTLCNTYIHRRTINVKEGIDCPRIFVQAKFQKPQSSS